MATWSGTIDDYPNVEKAIYRNNDRSMTMQMWMDINYGLPSDTDTYISNPGTVNKFMHYNNKKGYFYIIDQYSVTGGSTETWGFRGSYSFSDQSAVTNNDIIASTPYYDNTEPVWSVAVKDTVNVDVPKEFVGNYISKDLVHNNIEIPQQVFPSKYLTLNGFSFFLCSYPVNPLQNVL